MVIKEITDQYRRDFSAIYVCNHCGTEVEGRGYDDRNFHDNVIPMMVCKNCGKKEVDFNKNYRPLTTKYPDEYQV